MIQYLNMFAIFVFCVFQDDCQFPSYFDNTVRVQTNGFDADSEGSDSELVANSGNMVEERSESNSK